MGVQKDAWEAIKAADAATNHTVDWENLRDLCQKLFQAAGVPENDAMTVADCLVDAELCGVASHGVSRIYNYIKRLETGVVSTTFTPSIEKEYSGGVLLNANNGLGMVVGKYCMDLAIEKAKISSSCIVTVNNSNHLGMVGYYVRHAAEQGMLGFATTSAPPGIAPWGSKKAFLGTSPIAIAVPGSKNPILLDMAPSLVAMGKVNLAAKLGKEIPLGWALDKDGNPTTDAKEGEKGSVVPIGGAKGSGLSIFSQILGGVLSGAEYGPHINSMWHDFVNPQKMGHFFAAVDISKFCDLDIFKSRLDILISEIKALPRIEGVSEIFMPGEIENNRRRYNKENGVVLSDVVYKELCSLGGKYGVQYNI